MTKVMLKAKYIKLLILNILYVTSCYGQQYDVVVYGATASGVMAAIAASNEGMKVLLVEPGNYVGGMVTGGLSHTDFGDRTVIGGMALEFYSKVAEHYHTHIFHWRGPEPHVGEKIMKDWLKETGVIILLNRRVDKVIKNDGLIEQVILSDGSAIIGNVFIDAGYEGDLMSRAGVSYTLGREGKDEYNESWAGRQPVMQTSHQIDARISPFNNYVEKKLLPLINPRQMVEIGEGDAGIQSYCFRLIATNRDDNLVPWKKPDKYDPAIYELAKRYYQTNETAGSLIRYWPTLPNNKSDINSSAGISTNLLDGSSWDYPDADYSKRDSIWQWHKDYTLGLAWFLSTDPAVPRHVRDYMKSFGLCRDEYVDNDNFPHQLYIRIGRRMKGEYFMTQHDLMDDTVKYDAIGMGSYNIDVREVQRNYIPISRFPDMKYEVYNEGYLSIPVAQYEIPYRSLVPKFEECKNLIVPVCVSGSALAVASIRMEPQYMIMGHAAGIAASLAVLSGRFVQLIDVYSLQEKLRLQNQVLSLKENPYGVWNNEKVIIIDNTMRNFISIDGNWRVNETSHTGRYEMNFRQIEEKSTGSFEYIPYFFLSGTYDAFIWHPASADYESEVSVRIFSSNGESVIHLNQQKNGGQWRKLGRYDFEMGRHRSLAIEVSEGNKTIVADAVKFELVK
jgi:hypothetical protein